MQPRRSTLVPLNPLAALGLGVAEPDVKKKQTGIIVEKKEEGPCCNDDDKEKDYCISSSDCSGDACGD